MQSENSYIKGNKYYFYIKDHLGNNRVVADAKGNVVQRTDYYPYGMPIPNDIGEDVQPYKFGGKEYDTMHGLNMYDFEARSLGTGIPVFDRMDPLAEEFYSWSPYTYCKNNPILRIDPTGMYDFIGIEDNKKYGTVAIFPSNYKEVDKAAGNKALQKDVSAAEKAGVPIILVDDVKDLANGLQALSDMGSSAKTFTLNSHGNEGVFRIGGQKITKDTDFSSLKEGFDGKTVFIGACRVTDNANVKGMSLIQKFSDQTNSTIISSDHRIPVGHTYNSSVRLNEKRTIENMNYGTSYDNNNSFHVAQPGMPARQVYNVSISKDGTVVANPGVLKPFSIMNYRLY